MIRHRIHERGDAPRGGFTLLEVMIALMVLAFGMLGLAAMQLYAMGAGRQGQNTTQAATIAQDDLEIIQRVAWANLPNTAGAWGAPQTVNVTATSEGGTNRTVQTYQVRRRIADVVSNWVKDIDVQVTWTEPERGTQTVTFSTVRYNWE